MVATRGSLCTVLPRREEYMEMEVITLSQGIFEKLRTNMITAEMTEISSGKLELIILFSSLREN